MEKQTPILALTSGFFVDGEDKLWSVMKDGRANFVKNGYAFAAFSADGAEIAGVQFNGARTEAFVEKLTHFAPNREKLFSEFGYFYYPVILGSRPLRLAVMKADLLNKRGCATLMLMRRKNGKLVPGFEVQARLIPPVWCGNMLYYVSDEGLVCRTNGEKVQPLFGTKSDVLAVSADGKVVAVYEDLKIVLVLPDIGKKTSFYADAVTAMRFSTDGKFLTFAIAKEERFELYRHDLERQETTLILKHPHRIVAVW